MDPMKRIFTTAAVALLFSLPLPAQTDGGAPASADSIALRRKLEAQNYEVLSRYAAHPSVVAVKKVPRADFYLWIDGLGEGSWGTDGNWYPQQTERLYLSLPAEDGSRNIVWSQPVEPSLWSAPAPVSADAVSSGNEIFPMLSPDGKRLYFASDGLSGMGGYDLYVATRDPQTGTWGSVQNLGLPFNSPADDLFFCDTPDGRYSILVSDRSCGKDEVAIYVLRQETPVMTPAGPDRQAALAALTVNAPDPGYRFSKQSARSVPSIPFEEVEESFDYTFRIGTEGAFAPDGKLPSGLCYQVQLFVSGNQIKISQLKGISPVYAHPQKSGRTAYAAGLFRTYAEAEEALRSIRKAGFPSAFVIAFEGGVSLPLAEARKKESSVKVVTEEVRIVK